MCPLGIGAWLLTTAYMRLSDYFVLSIKGFSRVNVNLFLMYLGISTICSVCCKVILQLLNNAYRMYNRFLTKYLMNFFKHTLTLNNLTFMVVIQLLHQFSLQKEALLKAKSL